MTNDRQFSPETVRAWRKTLRTLAVVAGLFCLVVAAILAATALQLRLNDPLDSPALHEIKQRYDETGDVQLARHVRELDWLARRAFFAGQRQLRSGAMLLAAGIVFAGVCLVASDAIGRPDVVAPSNGADGDSRWRNSGKTRILVASLAVCSGAAALVVAVLFSHPEWLGLEAKDRRAEREEPAPPTGDPSAPPTVTLPRGEGWPHFRGWGGIGRAEAANPPLTWDAPSGTNILWQRDIPLAGFSSPVIWDGLVILTAADADLRLVLAYDLGTGEERWRHEVVNLEGTPAEAVEVTDYTGYAAPTPAVNESAVCAIFANGDLVCLDLTGERTWGFNLGAPDNHYGHSSSLLIDDNLLFVQYDHNAEALLMAFDMASGRMLWDVEREAISWGSPALVEAPDGRKHLVLVDESTVRGYDPRDGALLWQESCLGGEVGPSPAYEDGMVFVANEYAQASGVRIDSGGASEVVWTWFDGLPDVASPVAAGGRVYLATSYGEVICLDGADGSLVWRQDFDDGFYSSPIAVPDRIYLTDLRGRTLVFATGAEFNLLAENNLADACYATPAFVDGKIVFRLAQTLLCVSTSEN